MFKGVWSFFLVESLQSIVVEAARLRERSYQCLGHWVFEVL